MQRLMGVLNLILAMVLGACPGNDPHDGQTDGGQTDAGSYCGNGQMEGLEECDDGGDNSDSRADACRTDCTLAACGDGVIDNGEQCDDGPRNALDVPGACRPDCSDSSCGDGVVDVSRGEECDEGASLPTRFCSEVCRVRYCGNGLIDPGEICDDGNFVAGDGCAPDCRSDESCGNSH